MKPNEYLSVSLKALGILLLVWSLGMIAHSLINVIAAMTSDYGKPFMAILRFLANFIYLIGAVGMIIGSKIVAKKIETLEK
jgi:hypothetical protein